MVKRPKSPETPQDTRIFTVYQPYPLNPNWAFEEDRIKCVRWIAECIQSPDAIWSVLEKPSVSHDPFTMARAMLKNSRLAA